MKKILAYFLLLPYLIRANFLTAYHETKRTGKFTIKTAKPEFFKPEAQAIGEARLKALETGMRWYVVEPEPGKFIAVSEKYLQQHKNMKPTFQTS